MDHKKKKIHLSLYNQKGVGWRGEARKFLSAPWWLLENLTERAERGKTVPL